MTKDFEDNCNAIIKRHSEPFLKYKIQKKFQKKFNEMDKRIIFEMITAKYSYVEKKYLKSKVL